MGFDSPAQDHDCAGIGNSTCSPFHLLSYFLQAVYIAWDTLEIKEVLDNFKTGQNKLTTTGIFKRTNSGDQQQHFVSCENCPLSVQSLQ